MNIENELKLVGLTPEGYENFLQDCADKINGMTDLDWGEIIEKYNLPFDRRRISESMGRNILGGNFVREFYKNKVIGKSSDEIAKELIIKEQDIYKAKRKLQDERNELNRMLRNEARYEENFKILTEQLQIIGKEKYPSLAIARYIATDSPRTLIVNLSDLHIGATFNNNTGKYDSEIAKQRLDDYLNKINEIALRHQCNKCIVNILGDVISGNIHTSVQITNRENVVQQIMIACDLITNFIVNLNKICNCIEVYNVPGNHSRVEKNKDDALLGEKLDNLIPWYIKNILAHNHNIIVADNLDDTYSSFVIYGKEYVSVHGDFDGMSDTAVQKLCAFIGRFPYAIIMGHKHHIAMNEVSGIKVIQCGSLCGSGDEFTIRNRLSGCASQTILVCNEQGIEAIYPVELI